jgi:nitroreductase
MPATIETIRRRQSLRMPFDPERPPTTEQVTAILEAARWTPSAHNMQNFEIVVVDDRRVLEQIEALKIPVSDIFIKENYPHLSFSEEEFRRRKTGLLSSMFPTSWTQGATPDEDVAEDSIASRQRSLFVGPLLLVVLYDPSRRAPASEGDFLGIISLGCVMENIWLAAEDLGIGVQIVSALNSAPEVKQILGIPDKLRIAYSVRLGHPLTEPAGYLRVRRDIQDFAHFNHY